METQRWIIVGLGNPGKAYCHTRHNFGFLVVDALAAFLGLRFKSKWFFTAKVAEGVIGNARIVLVKPQTYMNLSGKAVLKAIQFFKVPLRRVLVVVDDVSLLFGQIRLKPSGSSGGHNGLKNIEQQIGTEYPRLRLGIGSPRYEALADYVLQDFTSEEQVDLPQLIEKSWKAIVLWIEQGVEKAMSQVNY